MSSSTLNSDRRWTSSRKGMTVLGKVPKPINLPSQRLENHGLDPNVEIVPKGTLTWGSRSAAPNAWSSSPHSSPSTEGSIGSPNHHNGRPSSGGSGTRPSTAGSDRCSDPATNVWASSSRPSSASGILTSNQAPLAATRPRSAETRPGSSQLSRFAEPIPENSVPWGSAGASGCLGPTSKTSNFTLSSGDFPTLGSAKDSETHDQQEVPSAKPEKDNSNAWKVTSTQCLSVSPVAVSGSWNAEHQSNQLPQGTIVPSHHYGWHGPPPSSPDGVWYAGLSPSGPYGPGVGPPGSYLPDPFAYYPSQVAARPTANTNYSPIPGALLSGYPHKKGDSVRPQMASESYMVPTIPVIPIRPGIYPGPMPYDGYYGPPRAGFFNSSEKERPIIEMTGSSGVYNQFQNQNVFRDPGDFGARPGSSLAALKDQSDGLHSYDSHGEKFRVLLKHHDEHHGIGARNGKGQLHSLSLQLPTNKEMDTWDEESDPGGKIADSTNTTQGNLCSSSPGIAITDRVQLASPKDLHLSKDEVAGDYQLNKGDAVMPPSDVQHVTKKSALIEKIEGLNNKTRTDGRNEVLASSREEKTKKVKAENSRSNNSTKGTQSPSVSVNKASSADARSVLNDNPENSRKKTPAHVGDVKAVSQQSATTMVTGPDDTDTQAHLKSAAHIKSHASHARSDQLSRSIIIDGDGHKIHIPGKDSLCTVVASKAEIGSETCPQDGFTVNDNANKPGLPYVNKAREEASTWDSADHSAQRAKMKEIAAERAKQLQKEEEERNREQKAKALAKLEELNRRASVDLSVQKVDCASLQSKILPSEKEPPVVPVQIMDAHINVSTEHVPDSLPKVDESACTEGGKSLQKNEKHSDKHAELVAHKRICGKRSEDSIVTQKVNFSVTPQINFGTVQPCDVGINKGGEMTAINTRSSSTERPKEAMNISDTGPHTCQPSIGKSVSQKTSSEVGTQKLDAYVPDKFSKQRHNEKRRNTIPHDNNVMEVSCSASDVANSRTSRDTPIKSAFSSDGPVQDHIEASGPLLQHKKKNNRSNRARVRPDHNALISTSAPQVPGEVVLEKPPEACKLDAAVSQIIVDKMVFQGSREEIVPDSIVLPQSAEEEHTKMIGQWKPHPPRRTTRNTQARSDKFRVSDSVVWAPVRSLSNKGDLGDGDQVSKNQDPYSTSGTDSQVNLNFKRDEMERCTTKFVAKDTSQSENIQTSLSVIAPTEAASNEIEGNMSNSSIDDALLPTRLNEVAAESTRQNSSRTRKPVKGHASWRQLSSHDGSLDALKAGVNPSDDQLLQKTGISPSRDASHSSDGWTDTDNTVSLSPNKPLIVADKDQGGINRIKNQLHTHKPVDGKSVEMDMKFSRGGNSDKPKVYNSPIGSDVSDGKSFLRNEKPGQVERTRSHWKPKLNQPSFSHSQQQVNSSGDASQSSIAVKELSVQVGCLLNINVSEHPRQQRKYSDKVGNTQQYDAIKERNPLTASAEDCSDFSCEDPSIFVDHDRGKDDPRSVQPTRGMHQQGQHRAQFRKGHELAYGARYSRGQEAYYGERSSGRDGYPNLPGSVDRQRHGSHYEYQKIEPHSKFVDQIQQNAQSGDNVECGNRRASGSRYKERGHFDHKPGGHFYTQSGGTNAHGGQVQ